MNKNQNQNQNQNIEKIDSGILKIESLDKEFNLVITQYEEMYQNYIAELKTVTSASDKNYTQLQGQSYWGSAGLKEGVVDSIQECEDMCKSDSKCTGATFNSENSYCWARQDTGNETKVTTGKETDYAIVPKLKYYTTQLEFLNNRLIELNKEIMNEMKTIEPASQELKSQETNMDDLGKIYNVLLEDKIKFKKLALQHTTLEESKNDTTISVDQASASYRVFFVIAFVVIFFTIRVFLQATSSSSGQNGGGSSSSPSSSIFFPFLAIISFLVLLCYVNYF